jgi:hypothetical protein
MKSRKNILIAPSCAPSESALWSKENQNLLELKNPDWNVPSVTAIYKILRQEELVSPRKIRGRVFSMQQPFSPVRGQMMNGPLTLKVASEPVMGAGATN